MRTTAWLASTGCSPTSGRGSPNWHARRPRHLEKAQIEAVGDGWTIKDTPLAYDYPDYRRAIQARTADGSPRRAPVDAAVLRATVSSAPRVVHTHEGVDHALAVLAVDAEGRIDVVGAEEWHAGGDRHIAVNREFLLEALSAVSEGQLVLELDGPIRPLAVRPAKSRHADRVVGIPSPTRPLSEKGPVSSGRGWGAV